jgi:hypothetical protein
MLLQVLGLKLPLKRRDPHYFLPTTGRQHAHTTLQPWRVLFYTTIGAAGARHPYQLMGAALGGINCMPQQK